MSWSTYGFYSTLMLLASSFPLVVFSLPNAEQTFTPQSEEQKSNPQEEEKSFESFTGKVVRNKVRLRLQPSLDAPILRELQRDDLLIVVGETEEFYAVLPPKDIKAYVFRTFVLDNTIEGERVNVRLEPALEAPIIGQLNRGDSVNGVVSPLNNKWLEIAIPDTTHFYVCKEYLEKAGSAAMIAELENRRKEVNDLLNTSYMLGQKEIQNDYPDIELDNALLGFNTIIKQYPDFPNQVARAKELQAQFQDQFLQKKIAYLEEKAAYTPSASSSTTSSQDQERLYVKAPLLENTFDSSQYVEAESYVPEDETFHLDEYDWENLFDSNYMTPKMAAWIPQEKKLYQAWLSQMPSGSGQKVEDFYKTSLDKAAVITGIVQPYNRPIKNKPGDYVLLSQATKSPIAYLYSTKVNLQDRQGAASNLHVIQRPNNNFAFPAYFVIGVE